MIKRWQPSPPSLTVPGGGWTVGAKWHLTAIFCIQGYTGPGHRAGCCVERAVYCRVEYSGVNHLTIPLLAALILLLTTKREVGWKESVIKLRSNKRHETLRLGGKKSNTHLKWIPFICPGQDKLYKHGFSCNIGAGDGTVDRMRKQKVVYKANKSLRLRILVIPSQSFLLVHNVHIKLIIEFLL